MKKFFLVIDILTEITMSSNRLKTVSLTSYAVSNLEIFLESIAFAFGTNQTKKRLVPAIYIFSYFLLQVIQFWE